MMAVRKDIRSRIVGDSPALREMLEQAEVAATFSPPMPILTVGEPGSGKELTARYIHDLSRPSGPFVAINCAALSPGLIESELFGHVAEAFTGATKEKLGAFERANGGTLFLDEIHTLRLEHQSKLNRVLSEMEVRRVGGSRLRKLDFRLITATNCDLYEMVQKGTFKEDLFDRLNVFVIEVPSLRERVEDILPIARHFLEKIAPQKRFGQDVEAFLVNNICPGNVRVLKNLITAAAAQSRNSDIVTLTHIKRHLRWKLRGYEDFPEFRNPAPKTPASIDRSNPSWDVHSGVEERGARQRDDRESDRTESSVSAHEQRWPRRFCMTSAGMRMDIILKMLENKSPRSAIDFRTATGASKATIECDLKRLLKADKIQRMGQGRNTRYMLARVSQVEDKVELTERINTSDSDSVDSPSAKKDRDRDYINTVVLNFAIEPKTLKDLMRNVGRKNLSLFRKSVVRPLLDAGLLAMTIPETPNSKNQKYRIASKGKKLLELMGLRE